MRSELWLSFKGKDLYSEPWAPGQALSLAASHHRQTDSPKSLGTRQPDHTSQTTHCSGQAFCTQTINQHTGKMCAVTERYQTDIVYLVFTDVAHVHSSASNNLQSKISTRRGLRVYPQALFSPSRRHKSQPSNHLPSPIVMSATTLTRQHLLHSLTSSPLSSFCVLPRGPLLGPRHPPTALKILIPRLKGPRSAILPFPVWFWVLETGAPGLT